MWGVRGGVRRAGATGAQKSGSKVRERSHLQLAGVVRASAPASEQGVEAKRTKSASELELEGHELIARGHARLAEAARARTTKSESTGEWIRVDSLPIPKRSALMAARSGALRAVKRGRAWLTTPSDAAAFLSAAAPTVAAANEGDDDVRRALGLVPRRGT